MVGGILVGREWNEEPSGARTAWVPPRMPKLAETYLRRHMALPLFKKKGILKAKWTKCLV